MKFAWTNAILGYQNKVEMNKIAEEICYDAKTIILLSVSFLMYTVLFSEAHMK